MARRVTVKSTSLALARLAGSIVGLGLAALLATSTSERAAVWLGWAVGVALFTAALASLRTRVEAGSESVRLVRATRTTRYSWDDVAYFAIGDHRGLTGERVKAPLLLLRSGESVRLPALHDFDPIGIWPMKGAERRIQLLEQARTAPTRTNLSLPAGELPPRPR